MKKFLGGILMVCVMSGAVFAATEPSLDELIELILQE